MRAILTTLGVLALAASASAATLKVPQQYETIQEAVNAAEDGDTIVVSKGVYYESIGVGTANLKIIGKKAVIDGSFNGVGLTVAVGYNTCMSIYSSGVTVQGFTFRNGYDHLDVYGNDCRVLKCVSRNAGSNGIYLGNVNGYEIAGNRVLGPGSYGIFVSGSGGGGVVAKNQVRQSGNSGIYVGGGNGVVIERNVVGSSFNNTGITAYGSSTAVSGNRVTNTTGNGISVYSQDALVDGNRAGWSNNNSGIYVNGTGAVVLNNSTVGHYDNIEVYGNDTQVIGNRALGSMGGAGFSIGGDSLTVTGNIAQQVAYYGSGFYIYNYTGTGGGTIAGNTAEDVGYAGFYFSSVYNASVTDCVAVRSGFRGDCAGFFVYGSGTTFEGCEAVESHGDGFYVNASGMTFNASVATDAFINGFRVFGSGNAFNDCGSRGSGGQGFQNRGTNTVLSGGVFLDNRYDITNYTDGGATFSGGLPGVTFETGGETTQPEIFWYD